MTNRDFYLACIADEQPRTEKVLAAIPEDGLDYRPHERSRSARELVAHILGHYQDLVELADDGVIHHRNEVPFDSLEAARQAFSDSYRQLTERVGAMTDEAWNESAKMWAGDHLAWEAQASMLMFGFLFDLIHHRGQLSTYLRPMGATVPAIYGPSADDSGE